MTWLLLREPPEEPAQRPQVEAPAAAPTLAWILVGGLDEALVQAGCLARLLKAGMVPDLLLGAGVASINAAFAAAGSVRAFSRNWERLRAKHFVASAAVRNFEPLAAWMRSRPTIEAAARHAATFVRADRPLLLASGVRFGLCDDNGAGGLATRLIAALTAEAASAPLIANALAEARRRNVGRVMIWGASPEVAADIGVRREIEEAEQAGAQVEWVTLPPAANGLRTRVGYLLPGSGATERAMLLGARYAEELLKVENGSGR